MIEPGEGLPDDGTWSPLGCLLVILSTALTVGLLIWFFPL